MTTLHIEHAIVNYDLWSAALLPVTEFDHVGVVMGDDGFGVLKGPAGR